MLTKGLKTKLWSQLQICTLFQRGRSKHGGCWKHSGCSGQSEATCSDPCELEVPGTERPVCPLIQLIQIGRWIHRIIAHGKTISPTHVAEWFQVSAVGKMIIGYAVMQKIGTRRDRYTYSQTFDPFDVSTIGHWHRQFSKNLQRFLVPFQAGHLVFSSKPIGRKWKMRPLWS